MMSTIRVKFVKKIERKIKYYFFLSYFCHISLWVHLNFEFADSLDAELNFAYNPYPHCILLRYPRHPKMKISIKIYFNIKICFFIEIFIFGCRGHLKSMQCGYGFGAKLSLTSNESPILKFGWIHKDICKKYNKEK